MDAATITQRWERLKQGEPLDAAPSAVSAIEHRYYRPLADAADEFVRYAQSPQSQVYTGFREIDQQMRGIAPGELCLITGYSHSGKTLALMELLRHNANRRVIYFCPDEPRTLTLIKLACLSHNVNALELERRVSEDDPSAVSLLRATATESFPTLAVIDDPTTIVDMERATEEISDVWGAPPDLVVLDYLELLSGGGEDVPSKANTIKAWGRRHDLPLLVLHQTSRTSGAEGRNITISSGAFGGEQQATHIIGVRRKIAEIRSRLRDIEEKLASPGRQTSAEKLMEHKSMLEWEEKVHQHTVTVNLVKNKRVGGSLLEDGIDYEINHGTGRLTPLSNGDLPAQYRMELGS